MKLKTDIAETLIWANATSGPYEGWSFVATQEGENRRWSRRMMTVLCGPDGNMYAFDWEEGLTENQEDAYPWTRWNGPEPDEIDVYPVKATIVTSTEWVRA